MEDAKFEHDEEQQGFLRQNDDGISMKRTQKSRRSIWSYLRAVLEIGMGIVIVVLSVRLSKSSSQMSSPVPKFARKPYTFMPNTKYMREDMFANEHDTLRTLHNWIELSAVGRGYVQIPNSNQFDLGKPYNVSIDRDHIGPAYMMSVFHQLHCLSYIVEHYQAALTGREGGNVTQDEIKHSAHCFDYLRQSIICSGDTNLEGMTETGPGWGSVHQCVDYNALLEWANKHSTHGFRGNLPEEAIL